ncbi:DUF4097 family beta strand repeat-containing protein [Salinispora cortesiana]|uniref:DUF4097 family beta strand repeat-containing protein n=1 Tax=Salinispora cortesiana TaxID=1305843 RepID=UPI00046EA3CC|nr:DUF4097 family beta strand repeat-containing protein [Salinispora cortesiana]
MPTFDTPTPVSATFDIPAGRIQLIAADRADTTVEVRPTDAAKTRDVTAAERIQVSYANGVLRIEATKPSNPVLGSSGSVEVTVQLPAGSNVAGKTASAEIRGVGRLGDVTFEGAAGSIKVDETATARLTLASGDTTVGRLNGSAQISTHQGDLRIAEAANGTVTLRTDQGDITIAAARDSSATLDAGTNSGRVHNALRNTDGAAASLKIHASTAHGDITATSR